jgi:hypothetical protein
LVKFLKSTKEIEEDSSVIESIEKDSSVIESKNEESRTQDFSSSAFETIQTAHTENNRSDIRNSGQIEKPSYHN